MASSPDASAGSIAAAQQRIRELESRLQYYESQARSIAECLEWDEFMTTVFKVTERSSSKGFSSRKLLTWITKAELTSGGEKVYWPLLPSEIATLMDARGWTILHHAAANNNTEAVTILLDKLKMPVDVRDVAGRTPLFLVFSERTTVTDAAIETAELLLARGADPDALDCAGYSVSDHIRRQVRPNKTHLPVWHALFLRFTDTRKKVWSSAIKNTPPVDASSDTASDAFSDTKMDEVSQRLSQSLTFSDRADSVPPATPKRAVEGTSSKPPLPTTGGLRYRLGTPITPSIPATLRKRLPFASPGSPMPLLSVGSSESPGMPSVGSRRMAYFVLLRIDERPSHLFVGGDVSQASKAACVISYNDGVAPSLMQYKPRQPAIHIGSYPFVTKLKGGRSFASPSSVAKLLEQALDPRDGYVTVATIGPIFPDLLEIETGNPQAAKQLATHIQRCWKKVAARAVAKEVCLAECCKDAASGVCPQRAGAFECEFSFYQAGKTVAADLAKKVSADPAIAECIAAADSLLEYMPAFTMLSKWLRLPRHDPEGLPALQTVRPFKKRDEETEGLGADD